MSTVTTWQTVSTSLDQTEQLAASLGAKLRGGEVIELISDLGGGKTAFVRGLARGMGSRDIVHSPSFTLSNQYQAGKLTLYHFDFYRLSQPGIMRDELAEVVMDESAIIAVEWAEIVGDVLPKARLTINIRVKGENKRQFTFQYPLELKHLLPANT